MCYTQIWFLDNNIRLQMVKENLLHTQITLSVVMTFAMVEINYTFQLIINHKHQ